MGNRKQALRLDFTIGKRTALSDGCLVSSSPGHMATEPLYPAAPGDLIYMKAGAYVFAVAEFEPVREDQYLYTYAYQREGNWTRYRQNLTPSSYGNGVYLFRESCFFRVCVKRKDGGEVSREDAERVSENLIFVCSEREVHPRSCFEYETADTVRKLLGWKNRRERGDGEADRLLFCLLADNHYTVNGTWEDTACNIRRVCRNMDFDAVIHLGDLTDGVASAKATRYYAEKVIADLQSCGAPVYLAVGNHDTNYFLANPEPYTEEAQAAIYRADRPDKGAEPYYYVDMDGLRCIFLSSFDDGETLRYGFPDRELEWVKGVLDGTPPESRVLVFSHVPPLAELDFWSCRVRNGEEMLDILERYQAEENHHILAWFYGHTHADAVCRECSFPLVSIGCAKCEFIDYNKPAGSVTPFRCPDTVTQDLWDVMMVDPGESQIRLVRFGAGGDRLIDCAKKPSEWRAARRRRKERRGMKVWAHRGASGYAPENTLPAFRLAAEMGADGVELDVQMTRDGELVVVHDERIDRVSGGTGLVGDYTLKELREFDFNRSFPAWGRAELPTLREVFGLLKETELTINVELKNSVRYYEGMEEAVCALALELGMRDRILYSSFNHGSMLRIKELDEKARVAFLCSDGYLHLPSYAERYGAWAIHPGINVLERPGANIGEECRSAGVRLHVWTVNTKEETALALREGAEAVITNYPDRIMGYLEELRSESGGAALEKGREESL